MALKKKIEKVYANALSTTFKVVNPIKKSIINTNCEVHLYIQQNALDILRNEGYGVQYELFKLYLPQINKGLVWADQDFKSYHHFYNPQNKKGKYGYEENALTLSKRYYNQSLKYFAMDNYQRGMFYFGAACHIIQDLTIPQHAKGKLLDNHRQFELYVKANYKKIKRFKAIDSPILLDKIEDYADYNSFNALNLDLMYKDVTDLNTKFYLTAINALKLAQRSSAGCMIMLYNDLLFN